MSADGSNTLQMHDELAASSSPPTNDALLAIIANLRAELVQTQSQLQQTSSTSSQHHNNAASSAVPVRNRRTSIPVPLNGIGIGVHGQPASRPASRAASSYRSTRGPDTPPVGYAGAPPSSLAAPMAVTLSTPPGYPGLRRDKSYEDLASVVNQPLPSPTTRGPRKTSFTQAQNRRPEAGRRRSSSIGPGNNVNGSNSRIPMPVIAKGSVGTATTLAGGSSPKSPSNRNDEEDGPNAHFEAPPSPLSSQVPYDSQYELNGQNGDHVEELDMQSRSASLPLPSLSPNLSSPTTRTPRYSTESEVSLDTPDSESRGPRSSAPVRAGSSPFFGGSAGFTERHGMYSSWRLASERADQD